MWTDAETMSNFGRAAYSASSPHSAADAYRFAASYASTAPVAFVHEDEVRHQSRVGLAIQPPFPAHFPLRQRSL
jgi:hypothetical protein